MRQHSACIWRAAAWTGNGLAEFERAGHSTTQHEDSVYIIGGTGPGKALCGSVLRLDVSLLTCETLRTTGSLLPRSNHTAVLVGSEIWVVAGAYEQRCTQTCKCWTSSHVCGGRGDSDNLLMRACHAADLHPTDPKAIVIFGGYGGSTAFTWLADPIIIHTERLTVELLPSFGSRVPDGRMYHSLTRLGHRLVLVGGRHHEQDMLTNEEMVCLWDGISQEWVWPSEKPNTLTVRPPHSNDSPTTTTTAATATTTRATARATATAATAATTISVTAAATATVTATHDAPAALPAAAPSPSAGGEEGRLLRFPGPKSNHRAVAVGDRGLLIYGGMTLALRTDRLREVVWLSVGSAAPPMAAAVAQAAAAAAATAAASAAAAATGGVACEARLAGASKRKARAGGGERSGGRGTAGVCVDWWTLQTDVETDGIQSLARQPTGRSNHSCVIAGSRMYAMLGYTGTREVPGFARDHWSLDFSSCALLAPPPSSPPARPADANPSAPGVDDPSPTTAQRAAGQPATASPLRSQLNLTRLQPDSSHPHPQSQCPLRSPLKLTRMQPGAAARQAQQAPAHTQRPPAHTQQTQQQQQQQAGRQQPRHSQPQQQQPTQQQQQQQQQGLPKGGQEQQPTKPAPASAAASAAAATAEAAAAVEMSSSDEGWQTIARPRDMGHRQAQAPVVRTSNPIEAAAAAAARQRRAPVVLDPDYRLNPNLDESPRIPVDLDPDIMDPINDDHVGQGRKRGRGAAAGRAAAAADPESRPSQHEHGLPAAAEVVDLQASSDDGEAQGGRGGAGRGRGGGKGRGRDASPPRKKPAPAKMTKKKMEDYEGQLADGSRREKQLHRRATVAEGQAAGLAGNQIQLCAAQAEAAIMKVTTAQLRSDLQSGQQQVQALQALLQQASAQQQQAASMAKTMERENAALGKGMGELHANQGLLRSELGAALDELRGAQAAAERQRNEGDAARQGAAEAAAAARAKLEQELGSMRRNAERLDQCAGAQAEAIAEGRRLAAAQQAEAHKRQQEAAGCLDSALADLKTHAGQLATAEADKLRLGNELRDLQARHKVWGQDMSALGPLATTSKRVLLVSRLLSNSVLPLLAQPDSPDSGASACRPGPRKRATGGCAGTEAEIDTIGRANQSIARQVAAAKIGIEASSLPDLTRL
ncbi:MAG: hypothetical protein WDW36_010172 [Sanguina aurantia]